MDSQPSRTAQIPLYNPHWQGRARDWMELWRPGSILRKSSFCLDGGFSLARLLDGHCSSTLLLAMAKENLFLCMGSACHQMGVYDVLPRLQALITDHGLDDRVELKGSFCLETCSQGIVMKFQDQRFCGISPQNVDTIFTDNILPKVQAALAHAQ